MLGAFAPAPLTRIRIFVYGAVVCADSGRGTLLSAGAAFEGPASRPRTCDRRDKHQRAGKIGHVLAIAPMPCLRRHRNGCRKPAGLATRLAVPGMRTRGRARGG